MNSGAVKIYEKKMLRVVLFGLMLAFVGAICNTTFQNFNVAATGILQESFTSTMLSAYILSVLTISICEFLGGLIAIVFNTFRGIPLAEYPRVLRVHSSRTILLSSVAAGPVGTACAVMAVALCGSTYANCVISFTPVVTAIFGILILKEKANGRVWAGIIISTVGILIAAFSPPEGITNFYLGIAIACICPFAYTMENIISVHAVDVVDPVIACPVYRMIGSAVIEMIVALLVCAFTGHISWIGTAFHVIGSNSRCLILILCCAAFMAIQYNFTYSSYTYCGATKAAAILWTGTFWSIPVGFAMSALNILDYHVTVLGVLGALVVIVGISLVVAKPQELFNLRNNES
jgi:drug/metabolite transporter (DMT)-like permease